MTIANAIVVGMSTRDLASRKGTSRQALKSWLVKNKHAKEGPTLNAAIRKALKKCIADGLVIADGPQRFRLDIKKRDSMKRAASKKASDKKKKAASKIKKAAAAKKKKSSSKKRKTSKKTAKKASKKRTKSKKSSASKSKKSKPKKVTKRKAKK